MWDRGLTALREYALSSASLRASTKRRRRLGRFEVCKTNQSVAEAGRGTHRLTIARAKPVDSAALKTVGTSGGRRSGGRWWVSWHGISLDGIARLVRAFGVPPACGSALYVALEARTPHPPRAPPLHHTSAFPTPAPPARRRCPRPTLPSSPHA